MKFRILILPVLLFFSSQLLPAQDTKLVRQPDISGSKIVFTFDNDLWVVNAGGEPKRLSCS